MQFEPTYLAYSAAGKPFGKTGYPEWLKNNYEGEIEAANKRIAFLESQRNASIETEKADARKALYALAGAHVCTPIEGYGSNASWAISDLCRAVKELADTKRDLEGQLAEEKGRKLDWMSVAAHRCKELEDTRQREKNAELKGWQNAIDSIRASLQCYPNAGGDIVIMQEIERIVSSQLAEAQAKCAELTQRLSQAQSRAGAALGMISDYGLKSDGRVEPMQPGPKGGVW